MLILKTKTKHSSNIKNKESSIASKIPYQPSRRVFKQKAGSTTMELKEYGLGKDLDSLAKRMDTFQDRLKLVEARYYKKFNAMDSAIQKLNNQSGYLSQLLGQ